MQNKLSPTSIVVNPHRPSRALVPAHVERKIAARWKEWEPWLLIDSIAARADMMQGSHLLNWSACVGDIPNTSSLFYGQVSRCARPQAPAG
jgi:hypothetical protein